MRLSACISLVILVIIFLFLSQSLHHALTSMIFFQFFPALSPLVFFYSALSSHYSMDPRLPFAIGARDVESKATSGSIWSIHPRSFPQFRNLQMSSQCVLPWISLDLFICLFLTNTQHLTLTERDKILKGMLGSSLIGFQVRNTLIHNALSLQAFLSVYDLLLLDLLLL